MSAALGDTPIRTARCPSCNAIVIPADRTTTDTVCAGCGETFRWRFCGCARRTCNSTLTDTRQPRQPNT